MSKFNFDKIKKRFEVDKPKIMSVALSMSRNHFIDSFNNQGFTDKTLKRWQRRKRKDKGRGILIKSGALKRSILIASKTRNKGRIVSQLKYSAVHNEGLRSGRGRGFTMPKRQFMGNSSVLELSVSKMIIKRIEKIRLRSI